MVHKRQGDVLLVKLEQLPGGGAGREEQPVNGRVILAYGEVTGHAHALVAAPGGVLPALKWFGQMRVVVAETPFVEVHEEHAAHQYDAGIYEVVERFQFHEERQQRVLD